jgi:salicylate hydroxylase
MGSHGLQPYAVAQASLGEVPVNIEDAREYGWVGDGAYLMHKVLNQGELVQFIIASEGKLMPDR